MGVAQNCAEAALYNDTWKPPGFTQPFQETQNMTLWAESPELQAHLPSITAAIKLLATTVAGFSYTLSTAPLLQQPHAIL